LSSSSDLVGFRITVCGIEELAGHCAAGVSHVLSILDPGWPPPPAFGAFGEHERLELRFHDIIEEADEMRTPEREHIDALLDFGRDLLTGPPQAHRPTSHLLVHCHMGISRSTAAMSLILAQACPDRTAAEIFAEVARIRPKAWPNLRMLELGEAALARRGEFVASVGDLYRAQLDRRPELRQVMANYRRDREVELAERA
jgi:predicted protein tyrosine phosphatase